MTTWDYIYGYGSFFFCGAAAIGAGLFPLMYTILAKWWRNAMGWHLVCFTLAVFLAFGFTFANAIGWTRGFGLTVKLMIQFIVFGLCAAVVWWRNIILIRAQHVFSARRDSAEHSEERSENATT